MLFGDIILNIFLNIYLLYIHIPQYNMNNYTLIQMPVHDASICGQGPSHAWQALDM